MNLLKEIRDEIISDTISLSTILRKARVLASLLKNDGFLKWVLSELNGYQEIKNVPRYRKLNVPSTGNFSGPFGSNASNLPIPTFNLPDSVKKFVEVTYIMEGVKALESLVESKEKHVVINWDPDMIALCQSKIYDNMNLYSACKRFGINSVVQILDSIRNKLLEFILQLLEQNPTINSEDEIKKIPEEKVNSAFESHLSGSYASSK